jgi:putative CocE/NonD family hydrolase
MTTVVERFPRNVRCLDPVFIPMSDGTRLAATIWLPEDAEQKPVPAILELIPYRRRDGTVFRDMKMHPYVAGHGFACCRVDIRGSGDSEGLLPDEYTEQEQDDACEIIAWLAAQAWSTGAVGMTGISWGGFNALQVAARRPPALKAIIALCCSDDRYADDVHYFGGCLLTEDAMWSSFILGLGALPPDPQIVGDRWRDMWRERLEATSCWSSVWLRHQRRDAYWKRGSVCEDFSRIDIPVYAISGWDDTYSNAVPRLLEGLAGPRKGLVGPWSHAYPFLGDPGPAIGYLQEAVRWWRHWLEGVDTGIMDGPTYTAWISEPHRPASFYPEHPGRFVGEPCWPSPNTEIGVQHLNASGLAQQPSDGPAMRLCSPVTAGRDCGRYGGYGGTVPDMAINQRREDGLGLAFDSDPLAEDFDLLGAPAVEIAAVSDSAHGFVVARLCEVWPDGTSTLASWGVLNLTHRDGHEAPQPLIPGEAFRARIELNQVGRRFAAGNRLRLVLSNQHWPVLWPSPGMPTLTLKSGAGRLVLPVRKLIPHEADIRFEPAEISPPVPMIALRDEEHRRETVLDGGTGRQTVTLYSDHGRQHLTDRNNITDARVTDRMEITEGDPLSAKIETGWVLGYKSADADVEKTSRVTLTADATRFRLDWRLEAREAGELIFEREGGEWIDRDHL